MQKCLCCLEGTEITLENHSPAVSLYPGCRQKRARASIRMQMESVCKLVDIKAHLYPRQIPERVREKSYPTAVIQDLKKRIRMGGLIEIGACKHTHHLIWNRQPGKFAIWCRELNPELCDHLDEGMGRELGGMLKRGDTCIVANSCGDTAEANTVLWSSYPLIKTKYIFQNM